MSARLLQTHPIIGSRDLDQARQAFTSDTSTASGAAQVPLTAPLRDTPWGTREFGFYDPDHNSLHFYRDLG